MKTNKVLYGVATFLLSALTLFSAGMYFFNYEVVETAFLNLGFPTYLIYPLASAKILGVIAIVSNLNNTLKEWAYAGLFFNLLLAISAHGNVSDGEFYAAAMGMLFMLTSYFTWRKARRIPSQA